MAVIERTTELDRLSDEVNEIEHALNRRLLAVSTVWYKRMLKARERALTAQALTPDEAEAEYGLAIARTIRAATSKKIKAAARAASIPIKEAEKRFKGVVDERAEAAANAARAQATFAVSRAQELGRASVTPSPSSIRGLADISNGGLGETNANLTRLEARPVDVGSDTAVQEILADGSPEGQRIVTQYTWRRGDPQQPFEPHVVVNGRSWIQGENEEDVLGVHPFNSSGNIFPGDHVGCQCEDEIRFVQVPI